MRYRLLAFVLALLVSVGARAQTNQPVFQSGNITYHHGAAWLFNGAIGDAEAQGGFSQLTLTNTGTPLCINDALISAPGGFHQLCFGANSLGGALETFNAYSGASALPYNRYINNTQIESSTASGVGLLGIPTAPAPGLGAPSNEIATVGYVTTQIGGGAVATIPYLSTNAALMALSTVTTTRAMRCGVRAAGDSPCTMFLSSGSACSIIGGDVGSQVPSADSKCWIAAPRSIMDPRAWGAYGDVTSFSAVANISSGNCNINVPSATFTSGDVGKNITITDAITGAANGLPYVGTISAFTDAADITVSLPCPTFSTAISQTLWYGHDDAAALNSTISYAASVNGSGDKGLTEVNGAGLIYGACSSPVKVLSVVLANTNITALCYANMPLANHGLVDLVTPTASGSSYDRFDGADLPINVWYVSVNGTTRWHHMRVNNWMGTNATPNATFTAAASNTQATITASIASCSGSAPFICTMTVTATNASIYPGDSLVGAGIPAGTYIQSVGGSVNSGVTAFNTGTYTVQNYTTTPAVGSESITVVGLDLTVSGGCNNINTNVGLISRGNSPNVLDRTVIVGCNTTTNKYVLNKAPPTSFSGATLNFFMDSNGIKTSDTNCGLHLTDSQIKADDNYPAAGNHYGAAIYHGCSGQSYFVDNVWNGGIAPIMADPNSAAFYFGGPDSAFFNNFPVGSGELNVASAIMMDASDKTIFTNYAGAMGQFEFFNVNETNPNFQLISIPLGNNSNQGFYAPNNMIWAYTEVVTTSTNRIGIAPFSQGTNSSPVNALAFTAGGTGSWKEFTLQQLATISLSDNPALCNNTQHPCLFPQGFNLATGGLYEAEWPVMGLAANYTFAETDAGTDFDITVNSVTLTIPSTICSNVSQAFNNTAWRVRFTERNAVSGASLTWGGNPTVYQSGQTITSPFTPIMNHQYELDCYRNATGTAPFLYLVDLQGSGQFTASLTPSAPAAGQVVVGGGGSLPATAANNEGVIGSSTTGGLLMAGSGSSTDIKLANNAGTAVFQIPTGTTNVQAPALSTGTNADFLCLSASGVFLIQTSACTISSLRFKDLLPNPFTPQNDLQQVRAIQPAFFKMKDREKPNADWNFNKPQYGLTAENVAHDMPECAIYEQDGKTPKSYRQECVIAKLIGAVQALTKELQK